MPKTGAYEVEVLSAFEKGALKSVATKAELSRFKAAARATAIKDRRVKALEEGMPYQTLIASVLHKYVSGRLAEPEDAANSLPATGPKTSRRRAGKAGA